MERCEHCNKEVESTRTAWLTGRGKEENLCYECAEDAENSDRAQFAESIITKLCNELNGGDVGKLAEALNDAVQNEHRQLQSYLFTLLWKFFALYSKNAHDARNEWAVKIAKQWYECL